MQSACITFLGCLVALALLCSPCNGQLPTNDDPTQQIRFDTKEEAVAARNRLIEFIWSDGLPNTIPGVTKNVALPKLSIGLDPANVASIDELNANVSSWDFHSLSYVLHPKNPANARHAVIIHQGHGRNLELGIGSLANHLLRQGFTVVLMNLPLYGWNTDNTATIPDRGLLKYRNHNSMVFDTARNSDGLFFRMFLEPIVQNVNHLAAASPEFEDISMIGLSGGGWATSMASALDSRIKLSIPIAGSCPLYQRNADPNAIGDAEQIYEPMYNENIRPDGSGGGIATWLELYVLGAFGEGRRQVQVSNEFDSCCFAGTFADSYKAIVADKVTQLGAGKWEHVLDSTHRAHQISNRVVASVINPALGIEGVVEARSGLPIHDDFNDQSNDVPDGWSVDPDFGSGASAKEAGGVVAISGKGRASIIRNVPFNPQRGLPVTIKLELKDVPVGLGVGMFLTDEVGARPHSVGLKFDTSTLELTIDAEGGQNSKDAKKRLVLGKVSDYEGGPLKLKLRYDAQGLSATADFDGAEESESETHPWSDLPSGLTLSDLGDRAYLFVHAFDADDRPVREFCIDAIRVAPGADVSDYGSDGTGPLRPREPDVAR